MEKWQSDQMGRLKVHYFLGVICRYVSFVTAKWCLEKKMWAWNMWANILKRVTRKAKSGGIEPTKWIEYLDALVK